MSPTKYEVLREKFKEEIRNYDEKAIFQQIKEILEAGKDSTDNPDKSKSDSEYTTYFDYLVGTGEYPDDFQPPPADSTSNENKYEVIMDVKHFRTGTVEIKTVDNFVVVHGKHEELVDDHGFVTREFTRRYQLPEDVDPETITSTFSPGGGTLFIQGLRKQLVPPQSENKVPINEQHATVEKAQPQMQEQAAEISHEQE